MKILTTFFLIVLTTLVHGQIFQKPNYQEIDNLTKKEDQNNYNLLLKRLQDSDTTLTKDQYYIIYYGQALQPNYSPYGIKNQHLINLLRNKEDDEFIKQSIDYLKSNPLDLEILDYLVLSLSKNGKAEELKKHIHSLRGFMSAILSSGNGKSKESAMHVMSVPDEYVVLRLLGLKKISQKLDTPCDVFELAENNYKINQIYFDVSQPLSHMKTIFK